VKRDVAQAVRLYRTAAEKGHAGALFRLGLLHAEGRAGMARDPAAALDFYARAGDAYAAEGRRDDVLRCALAIERLEAEVGLPPSGVAARLRTAAGMR
jgi:TPR repeat protein